MLKTCIIYARQSDSSLQKDTNEKQLTDLKKYAKENDLKIVGSFSDDCKGDIEERKGLCEIYSFLENDRVDFLLVRDMSRLARDRAIYGTILCKLKKYNIEVVSIKTPEASYDQNWQSVEKAERSLRNIRVMTPLRIREYQDLGYYHGRPPYGYKFIKDIPVDKLVILPNEAENIRMMFEMYNQGKTKTEIMKKIPAFKSISTIEVKLSNPIYCGLIKSSSDQIITGKHKAIVTEQEYYEALTRIEESTKKISSEHLLKKANHDYLSNVLKCSICGGKLTLTTKSKKYSYMECLDEHVRINVEDIYKKLEDFLQKRYPNINNIEPSLIELVINSYDEITPVTIEKKILTKCFYNEKLNNMKELLSGEKNDLTHENGRELLMELENIERKVMGTDKRIMAMYESFIIEYRSLMSSLLAQFNKEVEKKDVFLLKYFPEGILLKKNGDFIIKSDTSSTNTEKIRLISNFNSPQKAIGRNELISLLIIPGVIEKSLFKKHLEKARNTIIDWLD